MARVNSKQIETDPPVSEEALHEAAAAIVEEATKAKPESRRRRRAAAKAPSSTPENVEPTNKKKVKEEHPPGPASDKTPPPPTGAADLDLNSAIGAVVGGGSKAKAPFKPPADAADLSDLFVDTGQGDPLTESNIHGIVVDKPKDFFRVHPDPAYRRRCFVYTLKIEGQIEEQHYIVAESMRDLVPEAKLCLVTTCIYRNGALRLWLLKLPKEGEKDQMAWSTARAAARDALTRWTKLVWVGSKYDTRSAQEGYAGDPDLGKVPPFERLVELAFGAHGVMRDENHPVYRDQILGAAKKPSDDGLDL